MVWYHAILFRVCTDTPKSGEGEMKKRGKEGRRGRESKGRRGRGEREEERERKRGLLSPLPSSCMKIGIEHLFRNKIGYLTSLKKTFKKGGPYFRVVGGEGAQKTSLSLSFSLPPLSLSLDPSLAGFIKSRGEIVPVWFGLPWAGVFRMVLPSISKCSEVLDTGSFSRLDIETYRYYKYVLLNICWYMYIMYYLLDQLL